MAGAVEEVPLEQLGAWAQAMGARASALDFMPALKRCELAAVRHTKENFAGQHAPDGTPWPAIKGFRVRRGGGSPQALRDRGLLMGSVTSASAPGHVGELTPARLVFGTNLPQARTHQDGATIRPKSGKALAIPLTREAYRAAGPRNFGAELDLVWPKGKPHGWLVEHKQGRGKAGRGAKSVLHYLLVPQVTIPARPFLGWSARLLADIDVIVGEFAEKKLGGV